MNLFQKNKHHSAYTKRCLLLLVQALLFSTILLAQKHIPGFTVIPLGTKGGLDESNLSAYLVAAAGKNDYVSLDAGTLRSGAEKAVAKGTVPGPTSSFLKQKVKGYLISHPHLDHVAGLVLNSPDDTAKNIYGLPFTLKTLQDAYFTWQSWANFGDAGQQPMLKKYHYVTLEEGRDTTLQNTDLRVAAFSLSHSTPGQSTAFLLRNENDYLLYLGDTGPDSVEHSNRLHKLWEAVAPLVKDHRLHAIFIEVSYFNEQPDKQLFGHLTPRWLMKELAALDDLAGAGALKGLPIVITHSKYFGQDEAKLQTQIRKENNLQLKLVFPAQGTKYHF